MEPVTVLALYFILWWLSLFVILPFGVKTQDDEGDVTLGTVSSAPNKPLIIKKMIATTVLSAVLLGFFYWLVVIQGFSIDDIPFFPKPDLT